MAVEPRRRAVLVGSGTARLLALASELEAHGLEVALYGELARGLEECAGGRCDVLVAIGRLAQWEDSAAQRVAVPLVLLDAPDAPDLPLRPTGPHAVLSATVALGAAAARVLALLAPAAPAVPEALPSPGGRLEQAPAATTAAPPLAARPPVAATGSSYARLLFRVLTVAAGLVLGLALGRLFLAWSGVQ